MKNREPIDSAWLEVRPPQPKGLRAMDMVLGILVLAGIAAGIYFGRARLSQMWLQIIGKAPPAAVQEPEEKEGPMMPGRDF